MPFAIQVTEKTVNTNQSSVFNRYSQMIVIGTSLTDVTNRNKLVQVTDLADFTAKFGATSPSLAYMKFLFANDTTKANNYYFINGWVNAGTALTNLQAGVTSLSVALDVDPSVVVVPEAAIMATQADRTAIFTSLNAFLNSKDHLLFFNTGSASNTKALAIVERALYQNNTGDVALYYEFYKDTSDVDIPICLHGAVTQLVRSVSDPYQPPAGVNYPAQGIKGVRNDNLVTLLADFSDFQNNGINIVELIPKGKYCLAISRTISADDRFLNINTRVAVTITSLKLQIALIPFLQSSSDPSGSRSRQVERTCYTVMDEQFEAGALSADSLNDRKTAYKIELTSTTNASKRNAKIKIQAKFVEALELITLELINTINII